MLSSGVLEVQVELPMVAPSLACGDALPELYAEFAFELGSSLSRVPAPELVEPLLEPLQPNVFVEQLCHLDVGAELSSVSKVS